MICSGYNCYIPLPIQHAVSGIPLFMGLHICLRLNPPCYLASCFAADFVEVTGLEGDGDTPFSAAVVVPDVAVGVVVVVVAGDGFGGVAAGIDEGVVEIGSESGLVVRNVGRSSGALRASSGSSQSWSARRQSRIPSGNQIGISYCAASRLSEAWMRLAP
ncbi:hypothetical protein Pelo_19573 [Pelomyxa schiedti]|nr:hypothetical protein Pelo_19573 [Pelomyxa schiedti]